MFCFRQQQQQSSFTLFSYNRKVRQKENNRRRNDRDYITIRSISVSVQQQNWVAKLSSLLRQPRSQGISLEGGGKPWERGWAASYLQIKKETKEK